MAAGHGSTGPHAGELEVKKILHLKSETAVYGCDGGSCASDRANVGAEAGACAVAGTEAAEEAEADLDPLRVRTIRGDTSYRHSGPASFNYAKAKHISKNG